MAVAVLASDVSVALIGMASAVLVALIGAGVGVYGIYTNVKSQLTPIAVDPKGIIEADCDGCAECMERLNEMTTDRNYWRALAIDRLDLDRRE